MGTTIGNVLLSYDVDRLHLQVKEELKKIGYFDHFRRKSELKTYYLPNTTMCHQRKSSDQAISDLKGICSRLQVKLEKAVAVNATEFVGI